MTDRRHRGAALVAVLATLVVCSLLLTLSLRQVIAHRTFWLKAREKGLAMAAAYSGIDLVRAKLTGEAGPTSLDALNGYEGRLSDHQAFRLETGMNLGYPWVRAIGISGDTRFEAEAWLGSAPYRAATAALVVEQSSSVMFTSGETRIRGHVYLPEGRLEARSFEGLPKTEGRSVDGIVGFASAASQRGMRPWPALVATREILAAGRIQTTEGMFQPDETLWAFGGKTVRVKDSLVVPPTVTHLQGPGKLLVHGDFVADHPITIDGNLVLAVSGSLRTAAETHWEAAAYVGGNMTIPHGLGRAVLLARQNVEIGARSRFEAPSCAGIVHIDALGPAPGQRLTLLGGFNGMLLSWGEPMVHTSQMKIGQDATFSGYVYCMGRLELVGAVRGHVYTHELAASSGTRVFTNWLKDVHIDRRGEDVFWAMPPGFSDRVEVLQWRRR